MDGLDACESRVSQIMFLQDASYSISWREKRVLGINFTNYMLDIIHY